MADPTSPPCPATYTREFVVRAIRPISYRLVGFTSGSDCQRLRWRQQKKIFDAPAKLRQRGCGVYRYAQVRPAFQALCIPGAQSPEFVDDPPVVPVTLALTPRFFRARRHVPKPRVLVYPLVEQQLDVIEQELSALLERHCPHGQAVEQILRLRQNPRVAKHAAPDEHAAHSLEKPLDNL